VGSSVQQIGLHSYLASRQSFLQFRFKGRLSGWQWVFFRLDNGRTLQFRFRLPHRCLQAALSPQTPLLNVCIPSLVTPQRLVLWARQYALERSPKLVILLEIRSCCPDLQATLNRCFYKSPRSNLRIECKRHGDSAM
jgi:hypothetical protein